MNVIGYLFSIFFVFVLVALYLKYSMEKITLSTKNKLKNIKFRLRKGLLNTSEKKELKDKIHEITMEGLTPYSKISSYRKLIEFVGANLALFSGLYIIAQIYMFRDIDPIYKLYEIVENAGISGIDTKELSNYKSLVKGFGSIDNGMLFIAGLSQVILTTLLISDLSVNKTTRFREELDDIKEEIEDMLTQDS
jgi:hypothetical protein